MIFIYYVLDYDILLVIYKKDNKKVSLNIF